MLHLIENLVGGELKFGSLCHNRQVPFAGFDRAALARALAQVADQPEDLADAYFERREDIELAPRERAPGLKVLREEGFALRLVRGGTTWLASRDVIDSFAFAQALKQVARAWPSAAPPEPSLALGPWDGPPAAPELFGFPAAVEREIRMHHAAFPIQLTVKRHRRFVQVVGPRLVPAAECETFYSCRADLPWAGLELGRFGAVLPALTAVEAAAVATALVARFRARMAPPAPRGAGVVVLAPAAAAVFLHEAVAHALEADILALGGLPEAAVGVELASAEVNVLDDPASAPGQARRVTDDEGSAVGRRWLLRQGVVEQPIADLAWAAQSGALVPGAGRRGSRHQPPLPRLTHIELLPGDASEADLLAGVESGLYVPEAARGQLDPVSGHFVLAVPHARRLRGGQPVEQVGGFRLRGSVADLLSAVVAVGDAPATSGGWCAKGGQVLPVWATTPALRLEGVEVVG